MVRQDRKEDFYTLRRQHSFFSFEGYQWEMTDKQLICTYHFNLDGKYSFYPELAIPFKPIYKTWAAGKIEPVFLGNLLFHIGMVELISYWKAACPQRLIIKPFTLDEAAAAWWKNLYFKGLGEFFYLNGLDLGRDDFMEIVSTGPPFQSADIRLRQEYIVPVGGGKDSALTLELLKSLGKVTPMLLNPRTAMLDTLEAAGIALDEAVILKRTIDPVLLRLNGQGYLNGHTPFSALLAFQSLLVAYLCGISNIALSNEGSANEATIPGTDINHQYSKTYAFEKDFREYVAHYLAPDFNYFSFLRPLKELQIAELFSHFPKHFYTFRSCNAGSKTDSWCGSCPKCLFAWIMLSPFLGEEKLNGIFGKKMLDDPEMMVYLEQLSGLREEKPFECIGTIGEVKLALFLILQMNRSHPPLLVSRLAQGGYIPEYNNEQVRAFFNNMDPNHFLKGEEFNLLRKKLSCPTS